MHKLKQLSASSFLRLLFAAFTFAFFCSAFIAPDRAEMFTGLRRIMTESSKVSTNYFDNGGYAGTFLNAGLVCLVLTALYSLPKVKVNATSCLAFLLTAGFCFWGVNILNLWFGFLGVLLYCLVKRENPANQINAMVFTTGICPLFTDLMIRYPHADVVGFRWQGILLAIAAERSYHPVRDFLNSLAWDRTERIRYCLHHFLGAEADEYTFQALRLFLLGAIHRAFHPGCKFEVMLCLVGGQGAGKSTFFRLLAGKDEWFSEDLRKLDDENV